jgi:5-methylcytosine-specific restriction protein A
MGRQLAKPLDPFDPNWRTRWYGLGRWKKRARAQLRQQPFCVICTSRGITTVATVVDHVRPHSGNWNEFWTCQLQSLCALCHDSSKRLIEQIGYDPHSIDQNGWPADPRHPSNSGHFPAKSASSKPPKLEL